MVVEEEEEEAVEKEGTVQSNKGGWVAPAFLLIYLFISFLNVDLFVYCFSIPF